MNQQKAEAGLIHIAIYIIKRKVHGMNKKRYLDLVQGSIMGLAVGDALGVPAEFMSRESTRLPACAEAVCTGSLPEHGLMIPA